MKIYNLSNAYNKLFDKNLRNVNKIQNYFGIIKLFPRFILEIIIFSSVLLVMYLFFINENDRNDVVFFFAVLGVCSYKLLPVVQDVFFNLTLSSQNKAVLNYIKKRFDFLENNQLIKKNENNFKLNFDTLEVKNLSFSYDKKEIIRKANIKFKIGKIYGFVGPSGSGKTTLMDILLGLFKANLGEIIVGGKKIESEMLSAYQSKIGYCSHNPLLLNDTIRNNVIFFTENDDAKLKKSLEIANLNKFIEKLEYGLETYIDDNLSSISAGEAQRISLARTFYLDKKILILDEFTSNLDSQNEKELLDNITKMRENKIIIIVSHKNNPLEICDEVYQINDKQVDLKKK